jgi:hypothetical protein
MERAGPDREKARKKPPETPDTAENAGAETARKPETKRETKPGAPRPDPTRYGDWEKNGRCIDF